MMGKSPQPQCDENHVAYCQKLVNEASPSGIDAITVDESSLAVGGICTACPRILRWEGVLVTLVPGVPYSSEI